MPVLAVAAVAAAFVVLGFIDPGPRPPAAADSSRATLVNVNAAQLRGRPVAAVVARLRHLGLAVSLRWRASPAEPPGRVLDVRPAGWITTGSRVLVIGVLAPGQAAAPGPAGPSSPAAGSHHSGRAGGSGSPSPPPGSSPPGSPSPSPSPDPTPSSSSSPPPSPAPSNSPTGQPSSPQDSPQVRS